MSDIGLLGFLSEIKIPTEFVSLVFIRVHWRSFAVQFLLDVRVLDKWGGVIESASTTGELSERKAEIFRRAERNPSNLKRIMPP
jgi:hypothetical protein